MLDSFTGEFMAFMAIGEIVRGQLSAVFNPAAHAVARFVLVIPSACPKNFACAHG